MSPSKKRNRLRKNEEDDDNDSIESDEEGIELPDSEQTRATHRYLIVDESNLWHIWTAGTRLKASRRS